MTQGNRKIRSIDGSVQTNDSQEATLAIIHVPDGTTFLGVVDVFAQNLTSSTANYSYNNNFIANGAGNIAYLEITGSSPSTTEVTSSASGFMAGIRMRATGSNVEVLASGSSVESYRWSCTVSGLQIEAEDSVADQLSRYAGLVMYVNADENVTTSGTDVTTWVDQINGYTFSTPAGSSSHTYDTTGWGPTGNACIVGTNNSTVMNADDNADFAVGGDSFLVAIAFQYNDPVNSYETYFGNGSSGDGGGFRCFITLGGLPHLYIGKDSAPGTGTDTGAHFHTLGEYYVTAWGIDRGASNTVYGVHSSTGSLGVIRGALTSGSIVDKNFPMTIGGGHGTVGYRPEARWRSIAMFHRGSSDAFSNSEVEGIMAILARDAGFKT